MIKARRVVEVHHESHSCLPSGERALLCGKTQSTICRTTRFPAPHFTPCVFLLVRRRSFFLFKTLLQFLTSPYLADHRKVIGFSFDSNEAALDLWHCVERLVSNPENIALSSPGRKKRTKKRSKPMVLPPKSQISHPCQFLHVNKVTAFDTPRFFSLQAFVSSSKRYDDY